MRYANLLPLSMVGLLGYQLSPAIATEMATTDTGPLPIGSTSLAHAQPDIADGDPPRCSCFPWCRIRDVEHEPDAAISARYHLVEQAAIATRLS